MAKKKYGGRKTWLAVLKKKRKIGKRKKRKKKNSGESSAKGKEKRQEAQREEGKIANNFKLCLLPFFFFLHMFVCFSRFNFYHLYFPDFVIPASLIETEM